MIVFYGDDFELNLTGTRITLVEENPLFYNYFVKNYSWPFSKKIDDETSRELGFLELENSSNYETKHYGNLLIDGDFEEAYFLITSLKNNTLEGTIYYGKASIKLLDTPLNELPFPAVSTTSLVNHAKDVITKQFPEVNYNFPMIIDDEFSSTNKYEKFEGVVNKYVNGNFITNSSQTVDGKNVAFNRNIITPFPYLMAVLKTGFESAGMVMQGSFVSDRVNEKLLLYTDKFLERFYSGLPSGFQFDKANEVWQNNVVSADFFKSYQIQQTGSYNVSVFLNIPKEINVKEFKVEHNSNVVYSDESNTINKNLVINVKSAEELGFLKFYLKLRKPTSNPSNGIGRIKLFNNFTFDFSDGQLNIFPSVFSLSQVMPNLTFGKFLNKIKNWLNLEITFKKNVVTINYIEDKFLDVVFKDETHLEVENPNIQFNQNKLYKLITSNSSLFIGKNGLLNSSNGFRDEDITKIDMGLEIMPIKSKGGVFTAFKNSDSNDFKLMLYDGLKENLPVTVDAVAERTYLLPEIYQRYWKKWLHFRLNSETFKDKFPVSILEPFDIATGRFKYNRKHIYKKIKKRRILEDYWQVEIESETLP